MTGEPTAFVALRRYRKIILFVVLFFLLWTVAWLVHILLANTVLPTLKSSNNYDLLFWAAMKIIVWIVFPFYYVRKILRPAGEREFIGLQNVKKGILYGVAAGLVWVAVSYVFHGQSVFDFTFSFTLLWLITGTPIAEEFTFRGVILPGLQEPGMRFWPANIITSILFFLIHCLGWAFQGALSVNLVPLTAGSILLLSLVCGWLRYRSNSLYSSMILHSINNLLAAIT